MENRSLNDTGTITGTVIACCLLVMLALAYGLIGHGVLELVRPDVLLRASVMTPLR